jgi:uncharacterized protein YaiL (DUF2058 family)
LIPARALAKNGGMALGNLRNQLLKAGLVDKKQKVQADTQDRREKKQKGVDQLAAEQEAKQRAYEEQKAAEAEAQRQAEAARQAERAQAELENRVRNICDRWAVRPTRPGQRRFYYVQRSGRIAYLLVSDAVLDQLLVGALAIVERLPAAEIAELAQGGGPRAAVAKTRSRSLQTLLTQVRKQAGLLSAGVAVVETHVLLPPEPTERVLALDPTAVRFWARKAQPLGFLPDEPAAAA